MYFISILSIFVFVFLFVFLFVFYLYFINICICICICILICILVCILSFFYLKNNVWVPFLISLNQVWIQADLEKISLIQV